MKMEIIRTCGAGDLGTVISADRDLTLELVWLGVKGNIPSCAVGSEEELIARLNGAIGRSDVIILMGGMGYESNFSTLSTVCRGLHIRPKLNPPAYEELEQYCKAADLELDEQLKYCAWLPEGCQHLPNPHGCEQGAVINAGEQCIVLLPGNTAQAAHIFEDSLIEYLCKFAGLEPRALPAAKPNKDEDTKNKLSLRKKKRLTAAIIISFIIATLLPFVIYLVSQQEMGQGESVIQAAVKIFSSLPPQQENHTGGAQLPDENTSSSSSSSSSSSLSSSSSSSLTSSSSSASSLPPSSSSSLTKPQTSSSSSSSKPKESSSQPSSKPKPNPPETTEEESSQQEKEPSEQEPSGGGTLRVSVGGSTISDDAFKIICGVVQNEMGGTMHSEALKAQAVACYTYIKYENSIGRTPSVGMRDSVSSSTKNAVSAVLGQAVYYNGSLAYTTYHATSAGRTNSSADVWGGHYPYLVSVDSSADEGVRKFSVTSTFSSSDIASKVSSALGVTLDGDPSSWLEIIDRNEGDYVTSMRVGSATITGRKFREQVMSYALRSACFDISYDGSSFTITTKGYGHGVGMSQTGAGEYAKQGWSYVDILEHYYPGTSVK